MDKSISLELQNKSSRCDLITFDEESHTYFIKGKQVGTSVTSFIHKFFSKFDPDKVIDQYYNYWQRSEHPQYFGLTKEEIKIVWEKERDYGTFLHQMIEDFYNNKQTDLFTELDISVLMLDFAKFLQFHESNCDLEPFRTEMRVFDEELDLAGSIDMLYKKPNGKYAIYDWKRTKSIRKTGTLEYGKGCLSDIPDLNFWHYSLQLNMYKYILEKNYGYEVEELVLVQIHPNLEHNYKLHYCPDLQEKIQEMTNEKI